jgi:hypothetical protein
MKKQPEIHSRIKYFTALCGEGKQKDRSKATKRKKAKR